MKIKMNVSGLRELERKLKQMESDARRMNGKRYTSVSQYEADMKRMLNRLK